MSCVCGMAFLCGSTLVKVPQLLHRRDMTSIFKSDVKPKQTKLISPENSYNPNNMGAGCKQMLAVGF